METLFIEICSKDPEWCGKITSKIVYFSQRLLRFGQKEQSGLGLLSFLAKNQISHLNYPTIK